ncbi:MAG: AAA family ATPase [Candidatus Binataceae bacterium]
MIHRLEISNFYSLREPQAIDLPVAANVPDEPWLFAPIYPGARERAPKVIALFGPNASGKSNVLRSLGFLSWFIGQSFNHPADVPLLYRQFNDSEAQGMPTRLALGFAGPADPAKVNDPSSIPCRYEYEVVLGGPKDPNEKSQHVIREALHYWPDPGGRRTRLFERNDKGEIAAGKEFEFAGFRLAVKNVLRPNASLISTLAQLNHPIAQGGCRMAATIISNVNVEKVEPPEAMVIKYYADNPAAVDSLNREITRIDLGVRNIQIKQGPGGITALFEHEGLATQLPIQLESNGTRAFLKVFPLLDSALKNGLVAVIDELDQSIHPALLPEIIRWFHDPERNPYNAQLWMSCQNASLLEELAKEEVFFCEKDSRGRTSVYGLRDIKAVRRNDNYYRKYLGGVYGAVPHVG